MSFCDVSIAWDKFSWEAFATLFTGVVAVIAAYRIGRRQTDIQNRQTGLQEQSLRWELFDRRYKVYERTKAILEDMCKGPEARSTSVSEDFIVAKGEATFLFGEHVTTALQEIWSQHCQQGRLESDMAHAYSESQNQHYGEGNSNRQLDMALWIDNRLKTLPELFVELQIGGNLSPK